MLFLQSLPEGDGFRLHTRYFLPEQGEVSKFKLSLPSELHLGKPAALLGQRAAGSNVPWYWLEGTRI